MPNKVLERLYNVILNHSKLFSYNLLHEQSCELCCCFINYKKSTLIKRGMFINSQTFKYKYTDSYVKKINS